MDMKHIKNKYLTLRKPRLANRVLMCLFDHKPADRQHAFRLLSDHKCWARRPSARGLIAEWLATSAYRSWTFILIAEWLCVSNSTLFLCLYIFLFNSTLSLRGNSNLWNFNTASCFSFYLYESNIPLLISNFRRVLYVVCFLLGYSPASELCVPTFRNTRYVSSP